jgi:hypothetical protein
MTNQHAGLSQLLAEQRTSERREQAAHARLAHQARPSRRRRRWVVRGWWQLARWPSPPVGQSVAPTASGDRSEAPMSKHTRALVLGVTLAAMNLAGLTAVAQAQPSDYPASNQDPRRPPTERHVGQPYRNYPASNQGPRRPATEGQVRQPYRYYHDALAAQAQTAQDDAVERFRRGERASQAQPTSADDPVQPAEPSGQPGWLVLTLGVLSAALAVIAGLAVLAARRASRRLRAGHAA